MPAIQTTYGATHARWVEGMVLNMEPVGPSPWKNPNTGTIAREGRG